MYVYMYVIFIVGVYKSVFSKISTKYIYFTKYIIIALNIYISFYIKCWVFCSIVGKGGHTPLF